jgi:hypothetical protein
LHRLLQPQQRRKKPSQPLPRLHQQPLHQLSRPTLKVKPKPLPLKRTTKSLLTQLQLRSDLDDCGDTFAEEINFHVAYRRPELVQDTCFIDNDDEELPEHIRWKLFLARQIALAKYREAHG